jgi:L-ascorbate metabolism protein UlaG (beta-lactamase superfamily)
MSQLLPAGMGVRWLGHSSFAIQGPGPKQRFLFDPFLKNNPKFPPELEAEFFRPGAFDALLVTHPHFDHFEDTLPLLKADPALKVVTQFDIGTWLKGQGVKEEQIVGMNTGGTFPFGDVRITMVPAVHTSSVDEKGVSRALGFPIGFVLRFANGFTLYNTGDTAATMEMQIVRDLYKPDLVILPIGDFFTMGAEQAAYALNLLKPRFAMGCHWGTWNGMPPGTPEALEKELARYQLDTQLIKLQPGETLT